MFFLSLRSSISTGCGASEEFEWAGADARVRARGAKTTFYAAEKTFHEFIYKARSLLL